VSFLHRIFRLERETVREEEEEGQAKKGIEEVEEEERKMRKFSLVILALFSILVFLSLFRWTSTTTTIDVLSLDYQQGSLLQQLDPRDTSSSSSASSSSSSSFSPISSTLKDLPCRLSPQGIIFNRIPKTGSEAMISVLEYNSNHLNYTLRRGNIYDPDWRTFDYHILRDLCLSGKRFVYEKHTFFRPLKYGTVINLEKEKGDPELSKG
jgi:hypothetical protein